MVVTEKQAEIIQLDNIEGLLANTKLFKGLLKSDSRLSLSCQSLGRMKKLPNHEITNWTWAHQLEN